jgi:parvulin-like peptidyl-prolyl isomerase
VIRLPRTLRATAALLLTCLLAACGSGAQAPAAVVNGTSITEQQLQHSLPLFRFLGLLQRNPCGGTAGDARACTRSVLFNLIEERALEPVAERDGVSVPQKQITATLQSLESQLGDRLGALLRKQGLTQADLPPFIRRLLLFGAVQREVASRLVPESQLRSVYESNRLQFTSMHAAHILVKEKALADRIARIATAANFAGLARKYSTDPTSGPRGGDLGTVPATQFDPAFVKAALALAPGGISRPVHTKFGWHVIRLISKSVQPFEQVKGQIAERVAGPALARWFKGLLTRADVRVNPRYGKLDVKRGEIVPIHSTETGS